MAYKKVKRVVTVEFVAATQGSGYDLRVTPDPVVVRYRDTVVWDVQGLPPGLAKKIGVGNFTWIGPPSRVKPGVRGGLVARKPKPPAGPFRAKVVGGHTTVPVDLGNTDPGRYKYDLLCDQTSLVDPEMEIRGPRG